jgi:hydroxypyruvate reductase
MLLVTSASGVLSDQVAEHTIALLTAFFRSLPTFFLAQQKREFIRRPTGDLTGKTVGIVGMGRIGQAIARRCHFGFGMEVRYFNRSPKTMDFPAQQMDSLTDLAAKVDILVIATPGGAETRHLIGAQVLEAMQSHAHLVNIARGDVLDEAALIATLQARRIGGAGLDVYEFEPQVPLALRQLDNVTLLPHLGTSTLEVSEAMGQLVLDNLAAHFAGEPIPNPV